MRPPMPEWVCAALLAPASGKRAHLPPIMFAVYYVLLAHVRTSRSGVVAGVDLEVGQTIVSEELLAREIGLPTCRQQIRTALDEMVRRGTIRRAHPTKTQATITLVGFEQIQQPPIDNQPSWQIETAAKMWTAVAALRMRFAADLYAPGSRDVVPMPRWERAVETDPAARDLIARLAEEGDAEQAKAVCEHVLAHLAHQAEVEWTCKWLSPSSFTPRAWSFARNSVGAKRLSLDIQPSPNQDPTPNEIYKENTHREQVLDQVASQPPDPGHSERADLVHAAVTAVTKAVTAFPNAQPHDRRAPRKASPAAETGFQVEIRRSLEMTAAQRTPKRPDESHAEWAAREERERHELHRQLRSNGNRC